ncbi:MAG: phosphoribosylaminoimidazolesuccinocarboxamide synthase [bacterium]|nr:phosphoribosylaminoimidazolesuccinocarboxamide synthase [bacterium]
MIKTTEIKELKLLSRGKVRDIYELENDLLIVTTDRVSAFDFVLNQTIPYKGIVLNKLSVFNFNRTKNIAQNHLIYSDFDLLPKELKKYGYLKDRFMVVKKTKVLPIECIVRGYITGSAWSEYVKTQTIGGMYVEPGLVESEKFPEPIFTPSTKAEKGHDENISVEAMKNIIGRERADEVIKISLKLYETVSQMLFASGVILADTKMEFGVLDGEIVFIDEAFTPDSSRFWFSERYRKGERQESLDKQFIRNFLLSTDWDRKSPPPDLPEDIVKKTSEIYREIYSIVTNESLS